MGRKRLDDRTSMHARVADNTPDKLKEIAQVFGYIHGGEGSTGQLLDAIANGTIQLKVSANQVLENRDLDRTE